MISICGGPEALAPALNPGPVPPSAPVVGTMGLCLRTTMNLFSAMIDLLSLATGIRLN
jgi:hypothetical protein